MRSKIRTYVLAFVAVLAVSAGAASAAQATEGPFSKVAGTRLLAGETKELKARLSREYVLTFGTFEIKCHKQKLAAGAELQGSTGANAGASKETIVFEECTITGNGEGCSIEGGKITTNPLTSTLAYETNTRTGKLLLFFKPTTGTAFATVHFTGTCTVSPMLFEGSVAAQDYSGTSAVVVGSEPAEAAAVGVNFPAESIKTAWVETAGALAEKKPLLKVTTLGGRSILMLGRSELTLGGEPNWGLYTH